jgi:hypothetical protein
LRKSVESKYVSMNHSVQIKWEGRLRSFKLIEANASIDTGQDQILPVTQDLGNLSLSDSPDEAKIWVIDWNCDVTIVKKNENEVSAISKLWLTLSLNGCAADPVHQ